MALPKRFPDRDEVAAVREEADALEAGAESGERRRLAGRIMARRDLGKLMFCDLVDRSGRIQLMLEPADLDLGDIVGVEGVPAKTRRGEPSLKVDSLELLAKIRRPLPDVYHGLQDVETRYRGGYLDLLVNEDARRVALTRSRIVAEIRRYLTPRASSRSRRRSSSRATAAASQSRSSRTTTRSTRTTTCASRTSSISSG